MTSRKTVARSSSPGQPASVVAGEGERRDQVVAGLGAPGGDQPGEVGSQLQLHALVLRAIVVGGHGHRDPRAVRGRDGKQLAEHRDRQGAGVRAEQVGDAASRRRHLVQQARGDLLSPRSQGRAARRERLLHQAAQPGAAGLVPAHPSFTPVK
jgi:hypothetical protein